MNEIKHDCQFCKTPEVVLSLDNRIHQCKKCGTVYSYKPSESKTYVPVKERMASKRKYYLPTRKEWLGNIAFLLAAQRVKMQPVEKVEP